MHVHDRFSFGIGVNFGLPIPWIPSPLQRIRPIVIPRIRYVRRLHRNFSPFIEFAYFLDVEPDASYFGKFIAVLVEKTIVNSPFPSLAPSKSKHFLGLSSDKSFQ